RPSLRTHREHPRRSAGRGTPCLAGSCGARTWTAPGGRCRVPFSPRAEWWRPEAPAAEPAAPGSAVPLWILIAFTLVLLLAPQNVWPVLAPLRLALLTGAVAIV